ncbi:hypothetical protein [Micromonospora parva]|uniref:Uncharacterized protein n=1 Tax=Micromonospora parva TaxID=1464048 RepID=A0ABW6VNY0_9ACTN|nr:hypothetical protein [Micromonospora parva]
MNPDQPRLTITEDALEELHRTYSLHAASRPSLPRTQNPGYRSTGVTSSPTEQAACWMRMISTTEIYTEALLKHLDAERPNPAPRGWTDVIGSLKQRHQIDATGIPGWSRLEAYILVRNALAHGLGRFTAHQQARGVPRKVRAVGVPVRDGMVVVTAIAMAGCAATCSRFMTALDAHPRVDTTPSRLLPAP